MALVYVIEGNPSARQELQELLSGAGHTVAFATSFLNVADDVVATQPDVVLTELDLPDSGGRNVPCDIRAQSDVPIIVVTSRSSNYDELMSLTLGADDFVRKPYDERILLARIAAVLRRKRPPRSMRYMTHRGVRLDLSSGQVSFEGNKAELTKNELRILEQLMSKAGEVVTRESIITTMWESNAYVDDNTLTVNVNRLRRVLNSIGAKGFIITHRGLGYSV